MKLVDTYQQLVFKKQQNGSRVLYQVLSFEDKLRRGIAQAGLPLRLDFKTPWDNNCFPHAIVQQLMRKQLQHTLSEREQLVFEGPNPAYLNLKHAVADFMLVVDTPAKIAFRAEFYKTVAITDVIGYDAYWARWRKNMVWPCGVAVQGTAWFLGRDLFIIPTTATANNPMITISGNQSNENQACSTLPLWLGTERERHYQSLLLDGDTSSVSSYVFTKPGSYGTDFPAVPFLPPPTKRSRLSKASKPKASFLLAQTRLKGL